MTGSIGRLSRLMTMTFVAVGATALIFTMAPAPAAATEPVVTAPVVTEPVVTAPAVIELVVTEPAVVAQVAATPALTESAAAAIVQAARSHLGAKYQSGASGPSRFDCSGLVRRVFAEVGLAGRLGSSRSAAGLYRTFAAHHLASRTSPQVGDLVIWGRGVHVGIYIGHGRAISALVNGVRSTPVSAVLSGFTTYLHTHLAAVRVAIAKAHAHANSAASHGLRHVTTQASLRTAPGTSHRRLVTLHRGARLTVIGSRYLPHHRLWLHVRVAGGRAGWVASWLTHR